MDDCLAISENPSRIADILTTDPYNYKLKDVGKPTRYLGAEIGEFTMDNWPTWYMSARIY